MPTPPYPAIISVDRTVLVADEGEDVPLSRGDTITIEGVPLGTFVPASVVRGEATIDGMLPANIYTPVAGSGGGGTIANFAAEAALLPAAAAAAATPAATKSVWGKMKALKAGAGLGKTAASVSGQSLSIAFDDVALEFASGDKGMVDFRTVGIRVPLTLPADRPFLGYTQDLRLNVVKSARAQALIIADLAGTPLVIEVPANGPVLQAGDDPHGDAPESIDITRTVFSLAARAAKQQYGDPTMFPAVPPYQASLTLSVRRGRVEETASVTIESLDVRAIVET